MTVHEYRVRLTRWHGAYRARMQAGLERCRYECGALAATFDRLVPRAQGGRYTLDNVTLACEPCNTARGRAPAPDKLCSLATEEAARPPEQRWSQPGTEWGGPPPRRRPSWLAYRGGQRRRRRARIRAYLAVEHERSGAT